MGSLIKFLVERYFRFYFALMLLAFVLSILLMNLPRVLAGEIVARAHDSAPLAAAQAEAEPSFNDAAQKLVNWKVSTPSHALKGEGSYFEFRGSKMAFTVRF